MSEVIYFTLHIGLFEAHHLNRAGDTNLQDMCFKWHLQQYFRKFSLTCFGLTAICVEKPGETFIPRSIIRGSSLGS